MCGSMLIASSAAGLHKIDGKLASKVTIGFWTTGDEPTQEARSAP